MVERFRGKASNQAFSQAFVRYITHTKLLVILISFLCLFFCFEKPTLLCCTLPGGSKKACTFLPPDWIDANIGNGILAEDSSILDKPERSHDKTCRFADNHKGIEPQERREKREREKNITR